MQSGNSALQTVQAGCSHKMSDADPEPCFVSKPVVRMKLRSYREELQKVDAGSLVQCWMLTRRLTV